MAQNLVLSWLGGSRIMELKTVQILDELEIPRPCIDMQTVGYNVEWSQELLVEQSLHEYVKGAMLIEILRAPGKLDLVENFGDVLYDMSVGYDLKGIQSEKCTVLLGVCWMLPKSWSITEKKFPGKTVSSIPEPGFPKETFRHTNFKYFSGCPPEEIEKIIDYLFREHGLNCIIKLNPTLLGKNQVHHLLNGIMGYTDVHVPDEAFENDETLGTGTGFC
ncbi:MAG: hypothetical protein Ct9H300mP21_03770 [Pseudomonadota bacterium]|nr:MAG: hypothetical protein Ct9H300mP21_03770 [Pseudomonadota bacterium]